MKESKCTTRVKWRMKCIFAERLSSQINVLYAPPLCRRCRPLLRGLVPCISVEPPRVVELGRAVPFAMGIYFIDLNRAFVPICLRCKTNIVPLFIVVVVHYLQSIRIFISQLHAILSVLRAEFISMPFKLEETPHRTLRIIR